MTVAGAPVSEVHETVTRTRPTIEEIIGAGLMIAMVLILFVQVISRFVFSNSLSWSEELARYMFIWMIYLCLGSVTIRSEHIVIDVLILRLKPAARRIAETVTLVVAFALNLLILWVAADIAWTFMQLGQTSAALSLPMAMVYAALPVGMLIATLRTVQMIARLWSQNPEELAAAHAAVAEVELSADPVLESAEPVLRSRPTSESDVEGDER
ncbi:MAG: TRAP transporter small permease [Brachybacterium sp.]